MCQPITKQSAVEKEETLTTVGVVMCQVCYPRLLTSMVGCVLCL